MKRLLQLTSILLIAAASCLAFTLPVIADDYELQEVMTGDASGLSAEVNGSGGGWYGDSLRVSFSNNTGQDYKVKVPIGLRLVPADSSVQTMYTAGGESLSVPPGQSTYVFKGFCGEANDSGPGENDTFTPGGFADGDLMRTLQEINRQELYNSDAQDAVWHNTDGIDISNNDTASDLAEGGNTVSPGEAAAAGGAAAGTAVIGTVLTTLLNGGGGGGSTSTQGTTDEGGPGPDDDLVFDPEDEFVGPPGDGFEETPPPPEDDTTFDDARTDGRPPITDSVNLRTPPKDGVPPELQPPINIADIPPPEDPGDGIMIADSGGPQMILDALRNVAGGGGGAKVPENLPPDMKIPASEGVIETFCRWMKEGHDSDVDYEGSQPGGKLIREKGVLGSGGAVQQKLNELQGTDAATKALIKELKQEINAEKGKKVVKWTRRLHNLKSVTNKKTMPGKWKGPPSAFDLKKVLGPKEVVRDFSGVTDLIRDFAEPDVDTWTTKLVPIIKQDNIGHQAMQEFKRLHGDYPNENIPQDRSTFRDIQNRLKGK